jgi:hypothetical protein
VVAGTFNAQDVANTLWAYATMGRAPRAGLMRELEGGRRWWRARSRHKKWQTRCGRMRRWGGRPRTREGRGLMRELERRAEAVAGTFNAQGVANTLWAYATMGRAPQDSGREGLMRELEARTEALAGTFKAQDVTNILWAYATMGREPGRD